MNRLATALLAAAIASSAFAANASVAVRAADLPHITNGGTGFIGLTASAGQPSMNARHEWSRVPASSDRSQERGTPAAQAMGSNAMPVAPAMHRSWGTPD